jgi:hypothetical protein
VHSGYLTDNQSHAGPGYGHLERVSFGCLENLRKKATTIINFYDIFYSFSKTLFKHSESLSMFMFSVINTRDVRRTRENVENHDPPRVLPASQVFITEDINMENYKIITIYQKQIYLFVLSTSQFS